MKVDIFLKNGWAFFVVVLLTSCAQTQPQPQPKTTGHELAGNVMSSEQNYYYIKKIKSGVVDNRIKFIILHYTALSDDDSLDALTGDKVSAHYLIPEKFKFIDNKPLIYQLAPEEKRAWHAGLSNWNGRVNLNDSSIGIEIVNRGFTDDMYNNRTWYPYSEKQVEVISDLINDIINRYKIHPENILAHSDIAPLRKQDPGKLFPWKRLAEMGIGAWPDDSAVKKYLSGRAPEETVNIYNLQRSLKEYGYDQIPTSGILDEKTKKTISAFQMHFIPSNISGRPDAETESIAMALIEKYRSK